MKHHSCRTVAGAIMASLLLLAACGGKQTVASKSAEAFREAQQKGTAAGGDSHGGHSAGGDGDGDGAMTGTSGDHASMTGMDSTMTDMDHSTTTSSNAGAEVDHSKMNMGGQGSMTGMDHSKMQRPPPSMAGMDHGKMAGMQPGSARQERQPMAGMDHGNMPGVEKTTARPGPSMAGMDHGATAAGGAVANAPTSSATLRTDPFDAPVAISVSEAVKATEGAGAGMQAITPGQDRENPPTPAPATRDTPGQSDHSQHGQSATTGTSQVSAPASAPAVDHSQHGQTTPSPQAGTTAAPKAGTAAATVYTCPMHPEVTSDKPGTCPKCGMTLVKKK